MALNELTELLLIYVYVAEEQIFRIHFYKTRMDQATTKQLRMPMYLFPLKLKVFQSQCQKTNGTYKCSLLILEGVYFKVISNQLNHETDQLLPLYI